VRDAKACSAPGRWHAHHLSTGRASRYCPRPEESTDEPLHHPRSPPWLRDQKGCAPAAPLRPVPAVGASACASASASASASARAGACETRAGGAGHGSVQQPVGERLVCGSEASARLKVRGEGRERSALSEVAVGGLSCSRAGGVLGFVPAWIDPAGIRQSLPALGPPEADRPLPLLRRWRYALPQRKVLRSRQEDPSLPDGRSPSLPAEGPSLRGSVEVLRQSGRRAAVIWESLIEGATAGRRCSGMDGEGARLATPLVKCTWAPQVGRQGQHGNLSVTPSCFTEMGPNLCHLPPLQTSGEGLTLTGSGQALPEARQQGRAGQGRAGQGRFRRLLPITSGCLLNFARS